MIVLSFATVFGDPWGAFQEQNSKPIQHQQGWKPKPQCNPLQQQQQFKPQPIPSIWETEWQNNIPLPNQNLVKPGDTWPGFQQQQLKPQNLNKPGQKWPVNNNNINSGWGRPLTSGKKPQRPLVDVPFTIEIINRRPSQQLNTHGWGS